MASKTLTTGLASLSIHEKRYFMFKGGKSVPEIAALEKVAESTVERSVAMVQGEREMQTLHEMQRQQIQVVNEVSPLEKAALAAMLQASLEVEVDEGTVEVPDHKTRAVAVELINKKVEALQPKSKGGIQIVAAGGNVGPQPQAQESGVQQPRRFEDMVRAARAQQRRLTSGEAPAYEGEIVTESDGQPTPA